MKAGAKAKAKAEDGMYLRQSIARRAIILDDSPNGVYWDWISDKTAAADTCLPRWYLRA